MFQNLYKLVSCLLGVLKIKAAPLLFGTALVTFVKLKIRLINNYYLKKFTKNSFMRSFRTDRHSRHSNLQSHLLMHPRLDGRRQLLFGFH